MIYIFYALYPLENEYTCFKKYIEHVILLKYVLCSLNEHREDCLLKSYNINGEENSFILLDDSFRSIYQIENCVYHL